jgi:hypothetical protein
MCVHHLLLTALLEAGYKIDIEYLDGSTVVVHGAPNNPHQVLEKKFNILIIGLPILGPNVLRVIETAYKSPKFSFAAAGLQVIKSVAPRADKKYESIMDYTFSEFGLCSIMTQRMAQKIRADNPKAQIEIYKGPIIRNPDGTYRPDYTSSSRVTEEGETVKKVE